ncbi:unnamed protein product [Sphagnum troendelagicum]|uniref:Uncharacterized protein n=1 Tax=Sphagnum troendelagicum TaxID=128251 RepID=A0ABP0TN00_9BRYO
MVSSRGEWSEILRIKGAASILPPLASSSCETRNLSILEMADPWPFLPLSKVKTFLDIFRKLSRVQASVEGYVLNPSLYQNFALFDKRGRRSVHQDGGSRTSSLGCSHWDSRIPEGFSLPKVESSCRVGSSLLVQVVLLDEEDLGRILEGGQPGSNELLLV